MKHCDTMNLDVLTGKLHFATEPEQKQFTADLAVRYRQLLNADKSIDEFCEKNCVKKMVWRGKHPYIDYSKENAYINLEFEECYKCPIYIGNRYSGGDDNDEP